VNSYRDEHGASLTVEALIGRRAKRWHPREAAFGPSAVISEVSVAIGPEASDAMVLQFDDGHRECAPVNEVLVCAVDDRQVARATVALYVVLGQARLNGLSRTVVQNCARQILEAAVQRA
jgi:hypothetical protein